MIDMGVSDEYLFQLHAVPFDGAQDIVEIATWVDDGGFVGRCAPKDGAVLLQRRDLGRPCPADRCRDVVFHS